MSKTFLQEELFLNTFKKRIPLYTVLETTYNCNLNCLHCYIPNSYRNFEQLNSEEIKRVIYEIYSLGGMYLVFSGGEPLLREDIFELISYAKSLKFVVILFTNGSLITKDTSRLLLESGVDKVEVSLYGTKSVHNSFVGKDVFDKVISGISFLNSLKVNVSIKTVLTKKNIDDYPKLKNLARKLKINLSVDFVVSAKNNGDRSSCDLMLSVEQLIEFFKKEKIKFYFEKKQKNLKSIICSAGFNIATISADGYVYPCVAFPYRLGSIKKKSFIDIWNNNKFLDKVKKYSCYKKCYSCKLYDFCNRCPGMCYVETRSLYGCSIALKKISYVVSNLLR